MSCNTARIDKSFLTSLSCIVAKNRTVMEQMSGQDIMQKKLRIDSGERDLGQLVLLGLGLVWFLRNGSDDILFDWLF